MTSALSDRFLAPAILLCGLVCLGGYLFTYGLSRRLHDGVARCSIGAFELLRPLACGMALGLVILACRAGAHTAALGASTASQLPLRSGLLPALLSVSLAGICAGGWSLRPRFDRTLSQADLVRRLCVAGNTHEEATARIAVRLALAAGYDPSTASDLMAAASLHDVGKAGIPDVILRKDGALDATERRVLQSHTRIGHRMLAQSHEPMLDLAAEIALHHHERWDGTGYPAGLAGERIPLTSRAVALAETFDGLLSPHDDAPPPSSEEIAGRLRQAAGTQFDPRLVALLLDDLPGMLAARGTGAVAGRRPGGDVFTWLHPDRIVA